MTTEYRSQLINERDEIDKRLHSGFASPRDHRRRNEITSLLMTDGVSDQVEFVVTQGKRSQRVTPFTKDGR